MYTFLAIDDISDNLVILEALLTEFFPGSKVLKALTGEEGIKYAVEYLPDLILLDIVMPGMDGYEVCRILRREKLLVHIPLIIVTAADIGRDAKVKALESGADVFIAKPVEETELKAQVISMLRIKEKDDELRLEKESLSRQVEERTIELKLKLKEQLKTETSLRMTLRELEDSKSASMNLLEDLKEEIESRINTEIELRKSEEKYRKLFTAMQEGFALHKIICNPEGSPVDYVFLDINPAFERLTGLRASESIGRSLLEIMPNSESFWIKEYGKVALQQKEIVFEHYSREIGKHFRVLAFSPEQGKFATLFEDVTDRVNTQKTLSQSEEKFHGIFESVGNGIIYISTRGKIVDLNPAFEKLIGYKAEKLIGKNVFDMARMVLGLSEAAKILPKIRTALNGNMLHKFEFNFKDRYIEASTFINRKNKMVIGVLSDLTEQKVAETQRMELFLRQEAILGAVPDILMEVNNDKVYTWANEAGYKFFGNKVIGKPADSYFIGENKVYDNVKPLFSGKKDIVYVESWQRNSKGQKRLLAWYCSSLKNQDGEIIGALSSARDITEIKMHQEELNRSREQLQELNLYLQNVREEERRLISRELHDELGQQLTAVKIDLGTLSNNLQDKDGLQSRITRITSLVSEAIETVKHLTSELRPNILDDLGLIPAIEWYVSEYEERTGIRINLDSAPELALSDRVQLVLFRIIQESLTNIARHSEARHANIILKQMKDRLFLEISDNGKGISKESLNSSKSFGLLSMKERAREIGATLEIKSRNTKGTRITLTLDNPG